jgi:hypothetical protein
LAHPDKKEDNMEFYPREERAESENISPVDSIENDSLPFHIFK